MEAKGVIFNFEEGRKRPQSYTVTIQGGYG